MAEITESGKLIQRNSSVSKESDHVAVNIRPGTIESSTPGRLPEKRCIYKVPDHLGKSKEKSYTPQLISIGPLHHGNKKLQAMENHKVRYLEDFMKRAETNLENLVRIVEGSEERIRQCYAEKIELKSDEFVKMILHDATFIIEYFLRVLSPVQWRGDEDRMGQVKWTDENRMKPWQTARLQLDFLLLENQLPFFIIVELYQSLLCEPDGYPSFIDVTFHYFDFFNTEHKSKTEFPIMHFVDLLRSFYLPPERFRFSRHKKLSYEIEEMYSASQLAEAGLIFKKSASRCQLEITFQDGVLEIPGFTLDKSTELCARNLMALEELHDYPTPAYITDYFRFLDFLIDTDKDVGLLRRKKILVNRLGENCATIVNNLCSNDVADTPTVYYCQLCRELVNFYNNPWNSWKIKLRRDLSTPWVIVTTASAIFLLVLTLVQTVCTVISTVK